MHDDPLRDEERARARHAMGRARLIAKLEAETERMNRRWLPPFSSAWGAAAAAAVVIAVALLRLPARDASVASSPVEPDARPVAALTPGLALNVLAQELCAGPPAVLPAVGAEVREAVLKSYGMQGVPADQYELDYLITPELGGAPDARNLWPQRYRARVWNAGVKDQLEDLLPRLVCQGRLDLQTAQRDIAHDWVAAYRKYFQTQSPRFSPPAVIGLIALDTPAGLD